MSCDPIMVQFEPQVQRLHLQQPLLKILKIEFYTARGGVSKYPEGRALSGPQVSLNVTCDVSAVIEGAETFNSKMDHVHIGVKDR